MAVSPYCLVEPWGGGGVIGLLITLVPKELEPNRFSGYISFRQMDRHLSTLYYRYYLIFETMILYIYDMSKCPSFDRIVLSISNFKWRFLLHCGIIFKSKISFKNYFKYCYWLLEQPGTLLLRIASIKVFNFALLYIHIQWWLIKSSLL